MTGAGDPRRALRQACATDDPQAARGALLRWARATWPQAPPMGLLDLARRLDDAALATAVAALDRSLYARSAQPWRGAGLWTRAERALVAPPRRPARDPIPPLYPKPAARQADAGIVRAFCRRFCSGPLEAVRRSTGAPERSSPDERSAGPDRFPGSAAPR